MASEEHLALLKQGVEVWNRWREAQPEVRPDLSRAALQRTDLFDPGPSGDILRRAARSGVDLTGADLVGVNLSGVDLHAADLSRCNLREANLREADLHRANLYRVNLRGADLRAANLRGADLSVAGLGEADLRSALLGGTVLRGADLRSANLAGARMSGTVLNDLDLRQVQGLDAVQHDGPSDIGIQSIYKSRGKIPEGFLRGAGVPDQFISYMHSLVAANAIEYYSCFISYSSQDEEFARRLYADLQTNHVRCWFAPEDMKIGDEIRPRIDSSIRLHDKLLIVLSGASLASGWVRDEVETAYEQENLQKKLVLFPVRLDDVVLETSEAWAAKLHRQRHIGDFSRWKDRGALVVQGTRPSQSSGCFVEGVPPLINPFATSPSRTILQ